MKEQLDEVAPPDQEQWIKDRKEDFIKRYGKKDGLRILYATAWKRSKAKEKKLKKELTAEDVTTTASVGNLSGPEATVKRNCVFLSRYRKNNEEFILWQTGEDSYKLTSSILDDDGEMQTVKEWENTEIDDVLDDMEKNGYRVIEDGDEFTGDSEFDDEDEDVVGEEVFYGKSIFDDHEIINEGMNVFIGKFKRAGKFYILWQKGDYWYELTDSVQDDKGKFAKVREWNDASYEDVVDELKRDGYDELNLNESELNESEDDPKKKAVYDVLIDFAKKYGDDYVATNIDRFIPLVASKLKMDKNEVERLIFSESVEYVDDDVPGKYVVAHFSRVDGSWHYSSHDTAGSASADYKEKAKYHKAKILGESGEVLISNY